MILTADEIKSYIPTSTLTFTYLAEHEKRAMLKHLPKYLGIVQTKLLLVDAPTAESAELIKQLKGAIANLAILEATPFLDVVPTNTGFGIVSTQNIAPASANRVDNFKNAALKAAEDYLSDALLFLEDNAIDYPDWNKSSLCEGGLIANMDEWPREIDINYSRVKFVNLVPLLKTAERNWMVKKMSAEFIASIAGTADVNVLPDIQKALAFMAMYLQTIQEKESTANTYFNNKANEYLTSAQDYLKDHLLEYPVYALNGYEVPFTNDLDTYGFFAMG